MNTSVSSKKSNTNEIPWNFPNGMFQEFFQERSWNVPRIDLGMCFQDKSWNFPRFWNVGKAFFQKRCSRN
jgi:hypothetical protein